MSPDDPVEHRKASSQHRVLVVDDEVSNRELISDLLASEGYDVVMAQDGLDALNQLAVPLPAVIISNLRMPRMSGFGFLAVVREKYPDAPLIAISGESAVCRLSQDLCRNNSLLAHLMLVVGSDRKLGSWMSQNHGRRTIGKGSLYQIWDASKHLKSV